MFSTYQSSTLSATSPWTRYSSQPCSRAEFTTSAISGTVTFCRSASGNAISGLTTSESPNRDVPAATISRHASAMIAPPEYAVGRIHATVVGMDDDLIDVAMSSTAPTSPPGVSISMTSASAPADSAD